MDRGLRLNKRPHRRKTLKRNEAFPQKAWGIERKIARKSCENEKLQRDKSSVLKLEKGPLPHKKADIVEKRKEEIASPFDKGLEVR